MMAEKEEAWETRVARRTRPGHKLRSRKLTDRRPSSAKPAVRPSPFTREYEFRWEIILGATSAGRDRRAR